MLCMSIVINPKTIAVQMNSSSVAGEQNNCNLATLF